LHWIDSASEAVLGKIVDSESMLPLLLLSTRRPEYAPPWLDRTAVTHIALALLWQIIHAACSRRSVFGSMGIAAVAVGR
jgi:hypothetical protein